MSVITSMKFDTNIRRQIPSMKASSNPFTTAHNSALTEEHRTQKLTAHNEHTQKSKIIVY